VPYPRLDGAIRFPSLRRSRIVPSDRRQRFDSGPFLRRSYDLDGHLRHGHLSPISQFTDSHSDITPIVTVLFSLTRQGSGNNALDMPTLDKTKGIRRSMRALHGSRRGQYRVAWIEYIFCCYTASLYLSTRLGSLKCMRPERIMYETRPQHPYATQSSQVDVRENFLETPARSRLSLYKRLLGLPIFGTPRPYVTINLERLGPGWSYYLGIAAFATAVVAYLALCYFYWWLWLPFALMALMGAPQHSSVRYS
jgi:hypothetical protein